MPLYLAATPDRLAQARAVTPRLAHVAYRLGSGSELLAAPLPPALRGGAGAAADFDPPARPDRAALLQALLPLLASCGRALYVPEHYAACHGASVLLCTALSGGTLEGRLNQAASRYGAEHLALDLQRLAMDFPVPCPSGQGTALTREGRTHFILFDDAQTLRRKLALARSQGIRDALVMLPEVEDILVPLFAGEA